VGQGGGGRMREMSAKVPESTARFILCKGEDNNMRGQGWKGVNACDF